MKNKLKLKKSLEQHFHKTKNRMDAKGQLVWNKEKRKYDIKVAE